MHKTVWHPLLFCIYVPFAFAFTSSLLSPVALTVSKAWVR